MAEAVLLERIRDIATVTLNRPEKLNAMTQAMARRLAELVRGLSADSTVRCVILRGAGDRAFSAGADITEFGAARANRAQAKAYAAVSHAADRAVAECPHPTIAMIQGVCVGGGLELAANADIRICGESSRFGLPVSRLGLVSTYPEIAPVVRLVGEAAALEILLEARIFGAQEAKGKGLVQRVVPDGSVEEEVYATAQRIAEGAPLVNRWHKKAIHRLRDPRPLGEEELEDGYACFDTEDYRIGFQAFLDKTRPRFTGC